MLYAFKGDSSPKTILYSLNPGTCRFDGTEYGPIAMMNLHLGGRVLLISWLKSSGIRKC